VFGPGNRLPGPRGSSRRANSGTKPPQQFREGLAHCGRDLRLAKRALRTGRRAACHLTQEQSFAIRTRSGSAAARLPVKWANTLGTIKAATTGPSRAVSSKHMPGHLAEFECRFNRRCDLAAMIARLCWAGVRTTPMPDRLLKPAEVYA